MVANSDRGPENDERRKLQASVSNWQSFGSAHCARVGEGDQGLYSRDYRSGEMALQRFDPAALPRRAPEPASHADLAGE